MADLRTKEAKDFALHRLQTGDQLLPLTGNLHPDTFDSFQHLEHPSPRWTVRAALGRGIGKAFVEKRRSSGVVSGELFVGEASGATALVIDDLISTGGTLVRAARAAQKAGAKRVLALVTHGLFMPGAEAVLRDPAIDRIVVTDSVPAFRLGASDARAKIDTIAVAPLLAEAVRRLHAGETLTDLLVF